MTNRQLLTEFVRRCDTAPLLRPTLNELRVEIQLALEYLPDSLLDSTTFDEPATVLFDSQAMKGDQ